MAAGGFKAFLMRGNVVDLAVGVVIGAAFGAVVTSFTKDLLTPLIAAVVGKPDFSAIQFTINGSRFAVGEFINAIVSFVLVAAAVYYFVVLPVNALVARMRKAPAPADPTTTVSRWPAPAVSRSCSTDRVTSVAGSVVGRNFVSGIRGLGKATRPAVATLATARPRVPH